MRYPKYTVPEELGVRLPDGTLVTWQELENRWLPKCWTPDGFKGCWYWEGLPDLPGTFE